MARPHETEHSQHPWRRRRSHCGVCGNTVAGTAFRTRGRHRFFVKGAAGRYVAANRSLLERHRLRDKSQMLGRCPCDVCLETSDAYRRSRTRTYCAPDAPSLLAWNSSAAQACLARHHEAPDSRRCPCGHRPHRNLERCALARRAAGNPRRRRSRARPAGRKLHRPAHASR